MARRRSHEIVYSMEAAQDVRNLRPFDQRKVIAGIEQHLLHQPRRVSRSRIKAMIQRFWSQYRLRIDDLRVYYDVEESTRTVTVLRVLKKETETTPTEPPP